MAVILNVDKDRRIAEVEYQLAVARSGRIDVYVDRMNGDPIGQGHRIINVPTVLRGQFIQTCAGDKIPVSDDGHVSVSDRLALLEYFCPIVKQLYGAEFSPDGDDQQMEQKDGNDGGNDPDGTPYRSAGALASGSFGTDLQDMLIRERQQTAPKASSRSWLVCLFRKDLLQFALQA